MDWKDYENITKYIYEELGRKTGVKIMGFGNSFKLKGKSGVSHQIDILSSHSDGLHDYLTAIECKYWNKKINKDIVMKIVSIVEDTNIQKGVIVSKRGYTEDGISFAKHKNIGLVELRELEVGEQKENDKETGFPIGDLIINYKIKRKRPKILNMQFDSVNRNQKLDIIETNQMTIRLENGNEVALNEYIFSFKEELNKQEINKRIKKYYELENANLINKLSKEITRINGLTFTGILEEKNMDNTLHFNIVDKVWLIMKSIFENDSYNISKLGIIKKNKNY
ncbi:restriction endonuclease [Maribacter sp. PR1]|uniref:Restriction endonuclease n=1 Tax=Maribacter cobaltidurans TaxID=1178778 RepID=A0ABU7IUR2_9FLAO|nr:MULTISPECIES: restriction endonuclease [Maribacter]MDC6389247.1 restriction endonuclease [Maribacter sp. PR1]MEE1976634.1 restriction endonuclease [Maribacter cobaltidurans]